MPRFSNHMESSHVGPFGILLVCARMVLASLLMLTPVLMGDRPSAAQEIESMPKAESAVRGDSKNGKRLYNNYGCYECHGGQGQGSPLSGPRIGPESMKFASFVKYIRFPSGQMPPYTSKITSEAELADIYTFLQSLPQPPDIKFIPLLSSTAPPEKGR
jgi:mono/diheme cytochrome c family protein